MKVKEAPNGDPRSGKFKHWNLFKGTKHPSQAYEKTQARQAEGVCIACGYNPCTCKNKRHKR